MKLLKEKARPVACERTRHDNDVQLKTEEKKRA